MFDCPKCETRFKIWTETLTVAVFCPVCKTKINWDDEQCQKEE